VKLAGRLVTDLPYVFAAFRAGRISERKAVIVARETECLSVEDRERVDVCLAGDPEWIEELGDRELEAECRKLAYRFDPETFVKRAAKAEKDRRVTMRPAPDTMGRLTAQLPVVQAVAVYAALRKYAETMIAAGDPRGLGQLMADRLVELVTGQATADAVPVHVGVVMSDETLLGDDEPARVRGGGPIPARIARDLVRRASAQQLAALRRLYASPKSGQLVAMESRSLRFFDGLADLVGLRDDDRCRQSYCDAPIRDTDHAKSKAEGGQTSFENGQGLCEGHNIAKEAPGWTARPRPGPDGRHTIITTTPTGHRYRSTAPEIRIVRRPHIEIYLTGALKAG
jgi:hypothetical protein